MKKLTRILKICLLFSTLALSNNVWGNTVSSKNSSSDVKNGKIEMKGNHATFYLSGVSAYEDNWRSSEAYAIGTVGKKSSKTLTLSWVADGDYDIKVTNIHFYAKAYTSGEWAVNNGKIVVAGTEYTIGTIRIATGGFDEINRTGSFTNDISIVCKNNESGRLGYSFDYFIKNITITYTATPKIKTKKGSVEVTVCSEDSHILDLNTCLTNKDEHLDYHFSCTDADADVIETTFSASQIGTYTVNVAVDKKDNCHEAASTSFTVTVTPAALTLTAPTASDIKYHDALSASGLSGGSAKAGDCVVEGSWVWNDGSFVPNIGDDQPFAVTFVPAADAGNYTNFTTNALVDVKRAHFIFDGSGDGAGDTDHVKWCKNDNWDENLVPVLDDEVVIEHNVVIVQQVAAYSVEIKEGVSLTIAPTGGLTVGAGGITGATKDNLILKAGTSGETKGQTGYLRISPEYTGPMPEATVELFSIGYCDYELGLKNPAAWQYIGYPMADAGIKAKSIFYGWIYEWNEATGEWKNNRKNLLLNPFTGYAVTQDYTPEGDMYVFGGQFVPNKNKVLNLQYTPESAEPGYNVFANSYSAPIDITLIEETDFSEGVEASIHLFNTGSRSDAEARAGQAVDLKAAGQYISIPVKKVKALARDFDYPTIIPAMQGFYVNTNKAGTLTLDYEKLVWNANYATHSNTPLRAPKYDGDADEEETSGALCVTVATEKWSDNLYILESAENIKAFENGHDAHKMMNGALNVFAVEGADNLSVDATDNMSGTYIGVRTGDTTAYTLRFSHLRSERNLALRDHVADLTIDIDNDTEYMFFAEPNSMVTDRFEIVSRDEDEQSGVATALDNAENSIKVQKFVKNNQLYVLKNGVLYNAQGIVVEK
ncbi:MAG: hypothetical protein J5902_02745 [Paludibacteraceae bacterium]|nr:hypothetical protein [Paludibacteraceae bacterium]